MPIPYPKSFITLLLIGFSLVALPFLFVFATATLYLDDITRQSRAAVAQAAQATQDSRTLLELLARMERAARQYLVVGDPGLLHVYSETRRQFDKTAHTLATLLTEPVQRHTLETLTQRADAIDVELAARDGKARHALTQEFTSLFTQANTIMAASNHLIDQETSTLQSSAERAQRILTWQALLLIPFALLAAVGIAYLIARPLRQLDQAIHDLGSGQTTGEISVTGPEDLQRLGERLDWLRMQINEMEAQKNRFLREVSHELKTPLTAIREGTSLLQEGAVGHLNHQQQEIAAILQDSASRLQRMIEALLQYSAVRFNDAPILENVALDEVLREALSEHALSVASRGIHLFTSIGRVSLQGDRHKLAVLIDNLLSNAVKFTPSEGTIKVMLHVGHGEAVLDVLNSGARIAAEDKPHVFEPFYQGKTPQPESRVKGSGLGLSIALDCARAHRGSIEIVDNALWAGAHFRVRLPLESARSKDETT